MTIALGLVGFYVAIQIANTQLDVPIDLSNGSEATRYSVVCNEVTNVCDVHFSGIIGPQDKYRGLYELIENAPAGSKIRLHLYGVGGYVDTVIHLYNSINASKAEIDTIIEGPVYTAHAMIAMMGHHIIVSDASFFMFHLPAIFDPNRAENVLPEQVCIYSLGDKDRGQDAYKKCMDASAAESKIINDMLNNTSYKYLTLEELQRVKEGYDVYVYAEDMRARLGQQSLEEGN